MYRGDIRLGDTIDLKFTTRSFSTGAPTTLAGSPSIAAYPNNSTTEITAGITLTVDFDTRTGLHNVRVVATSGNGYATATNYDLVITAGTVGGVSVVGEVIGSFSIEARSAVMPTVAGRTLDVSAGGEAGIDWANVGTPGSTVSLSGTTVATVTTATTATNVTTVNGLAANTITAASIAASALNGKGDWNIGKTGYSLTQTFPTNFSALAITVGGAVTAGTVSDKTGYSLTATTGLGNQTANITGNLSGSVGSVTGAVGSVTGNVGGNVAGSVASVTAGVTVTTNNDKTGYALSAAGVDAIWDEATSGHSTAGTTGKALTDAGSAGDPWSTALPGAYGAGTAGKIIGDNIDAAISSRLATSGYTAPLSAAGTRTALGMASADLDTQLAALPTATENADALLGRNVAGGSDGTRTVSQALYVLRNKTAISGGTLTVYQTDDATPSFTATVGTTAGDPISSIDPA